MHCSHGKMEFGGRGPLVSGGDGTGSFSDALQPLDGGCGDWHRRLLLGRGQVPHLYAAHRPALGYEVTDLRQTDTSISTGPGIRSSHAVTSASGALKPKSEYEVGPQREGRPGSEESAYAWNEYRD